MVITCKIPDELAARLTTAAQAEHRSKSAILRESLKARLNATDSAKSKTSWDRVKHLYGSIKGDSHITDLATNPEHLRGFGEQGAHPAGHWPAGVFSSR